MAPDQQKEQYGRSYVHAVAAVAGFAWSVPSVDDDSVDMTLHQRGGGGTIRSPQLDLQLKCKSAPTPTEAEFSHSLKLKNYDDLREEGVLVPRILVVVLVPDDLRGCDLIGRARPLPSRGPKARQEPVTRHIVLRGNPDT
jgi:hypothetical protein